MVLISGMDCMGYDLGSVGIQERGLLLSASVQGHGTGTKDGDSKERSI